MARTKRQPVLLDRIIETVDVLDAKVPKLINKLKKTDVSDEAFGTILVNLDKAVTMDLNLRKLANQAINELNAQAAQKTKEDTKNTNKGE